MLEALQVLQDWSVLNQVVLLQELRPHLLIIDLKEWKDLRHLQEKVCRQEQNLRLLIINLRGWKEQRQHQEKVRQLEQNLLRLTAEQKDQLLLHEKVLRLGLNHLEEVVVRKE